MRPPLVAFGLKPVVLCSRPIEKGAFLHKCLAHVNGSGAVGDGLHLILRFQNLRTRKPVGKPSSGIDT